MLLKNKLYLNSRRDCCMSNFHRIIWIDRQIRAQRYPSSQTIASKFEISVRQASRDIEYMRYSMGAPIKYSTSKKGYFYDDKENAYVLPSQYISDEDKKILTYFAHQYSNMGNARHLADLFSRLSGEERDSSALNSIPMISITPKELDSYQKLLDCIENHSKVELYYLNAKNEMSKRIFCPYKLFTKNRINYVVGYCELKEELRIFRLSRIKNIETTKLKFDPLPHFNENDYNEHSSFKILDPYHAVIYFYYPNDICNLNYPFTKIDSNKHQIKFYHSEKLLSDLLRYSKKFTIISPSWLKQKLIEKAQQIITNHS